MAGRRFFTAEACVFRIITKGQKGMANKSFADVQEFLKGKVILVANRGIPARRICRSIRERFDAVAAMTATDVDKTAPSASTAKELILLGPDPRAYLDIDRIIDKARQRGVVVSIPAGALPLRTPVSPSAARKPVSPLSVPLPKP